jgi:hypothetical protein
MTVWPGTLVPVPLLLVPQVRLVKGSVLLFGSSSEPGELLEDADVAELPPEFYLREFLELDASDPAEVLAFCKKWGPVGRGDCSDLPDLPYAGRYALDADRAMPLPWSAGWEYFDQEGRERTMRRFGFRQIREVHSVGRVAVYRDALFNMLQLWRFLQGGLSAPELAEAARPASGNIYMALRRKELSTIDATRASFELMIQLNGALQAFHVRLELHTNKFAPLGAPLPNVFEACCLQLANHIAENATYSRCANETCGRLFVRQRGGSKIAESRGAEHGQYHTRSVLYCTPQCARAQAARAARRRRSEAKAGERE